MGTGGFYSRRRVRGDMARAPVYLLSVVGVVVGQAIMLYGVYLTSGETMNAPMVIGGLIALAAVGALTAGLFQEETPASQSH